MRGVEGKLFLMAVMCGLVSAPASAATITVHSGGIVINSSDTSTDGDLEFPWLLSETMTSPGIVTIVDNEEDHALGENTTGSSHDYGKWLRKTIFNNTPESWTSFELELQVVPGTASLDGDGLSFAQGSAFSFVSNVFATYTAIEDVRDYLNFSGGVVMPGESVTFSFAMTDNVERNQIYLAQTPNIRDVPEVPQVPEPASLLLLGSGLVTAGMRKYRQSRARQ